MWARIESHQGESFQQKRGGTFEYTVDGNLLTITRIPTHPLHRGNFERALSRLPVDGPGELRDLRGPSYVYAILMDRCIRGNDW